MEKISLGHLKNLVKIIKELERYQEQNPTAEIFYHFDTQQISIELSLPEDYINLVKYGFNP